MRPVQTEWKTGLQRVGEGCHAYIQAGGLNVSNAGLIVGEDSARVVDTLYVRPMTQAFRRAIRKATKKPVRQIVCTHHHADHTLGLAWFPLEVPIVAHCHMRERMIETGLDLAHYRSVNPEYAQEFKNLKQRFPTETYGGTLTFYLGRRRVELHHLGHAHSKGDTLVYLPEERVLYTGDICFNFVTPSTFDADIGG
jgi:cyclase